MNDSSAESCEYCGYIFETVGAIPDSSVVSSDGSSKNNFATPGVISTEPLGYSNNKPSASSVSSPVFVVKSTWHDGRNLGSLIAGCALAVLYVGLNYPLFTPANFSPESLIFLILPVILIAPAFTTRNRTFEFYQDSLVVRGFRAQKGIQYSEISSVRAANKGRIFLTVTNSWRVIQVQGTTIVNTSGQNLESWLNQKIRPQNED